MTTKERDVERGNNMWKGSVPSFQFFVVVCAGVNNCAHTLVVLVLCVFGTCRAFLLAEVFLTWCPRVDFSCAPVFVCLKGP